MSSIGERIKETRKLLLLNQQSFADELGISRAHISNMENGNDNPSSALIKLICMKFNIDEEWLATGQGSPEVGFDLSTDEGTIAKYNAMRVEFERKLRQRSGEDLVNTVESFAFLDSLLSTNKLKDEQDKSEYLRNIRQSIDEFECLIFKASRADLLSKKTDSRHWLSIKNQCEKRMKKIVENIKTAANIHLKKFGDDMLL